MTRQASNPFLKRLYLDSLHQTVLYVENDNDKAYLVAMYIVPANIAVVVATPMHFTDQDKLQFIEGLLLALLPPDTIFSKAKPT